MKKRKQFKLPGALLILIILIAVTIFGCDNSTSEENDNITPDENSDEDTSDLDIAISDEDKSPSMNYEKEFEESLSAWETKKSEIGNSYTYKRSFSSWTGYGGETTVTVKNGIVTERSYIGHDRDETTGEQIVTSEWAEVGDDVGTHKNEAYPAALLGKLYEECKRDVLPQSPEENEITFKTDSDGLLQSCYYVPFNCADDCLFGITIDKIVY